MRLRGSDATEWEWAAHAVIDGVVPSAHRWAHSSIRA